MGHPRRLELTRVDLLVLFTTNYSTRDAQVLYKAFWLDVAEGRLKGESNEIQTHSCRFASVAP